MKARNSLQPGSESPEADSYAVFSVQDQVITQHRCQALVSKESLHLRLWDSKDQLVPDKREGTQRLGNVCLEIMLKKCPVSDRSELYVSVTHPRR